MRTRRTPLLLVLALLTVVVLPAAAQAGAVSSGPTGGGVFDIFYQSGASEADSLLIDFENPDKVVITGTVALAGGETHCVFFVPTVSCADEKAGSDLDELRLDLGSRDDTVFADDDFAFPLVVTAGTGDDKVFGGADGDDLEGGGNADELDGGAGGDSLDGEEGDDELNPGLGADDVRGGPGIDLAKYQRAAGTSVTVTLDDNPNDGAAGEGDNVRDDVENLNGGSENNTFIGSALPNRLSGSSGTDLLDGAGGDDLLIGGSGPDELRGGTEVDTADYSSSGLPVVVSLNELPDDGTVTDAGSAGDGGESEGDNVRSTVENLIGGSVDDRLTGDGGNNHLVGNAGNDILEGGPGIDTWDDGEGDDLLRTRDGIAEVVICGPGNDTAETDTIDLVTGCETVNASSELEADADHDGVAKPTDCDDANPAIRPGATDVPGNRVDEDCSGEPEPFPRIAPNVSFSYLFTARGIRLTTALKVAKVPKGAKVRFVCRLPGKRKCGSQRATARRGKVNLRRAKGKSLPARASLQVFVTASGHIGRHLKYTVRRLKRPRRRSRCIPAGKSKPAKSCPSFS